MGQYHDRQSRNEVKKDDALPWFRYVNKAVNDYLVRDDATPIILCCDEEYETRLPQALHAASPPARRHQEGSRRS
ncbi:MAG: hypothetical protein V8Q09_10845 [Adlercreutzia sp.]